MAFIVEDGTGLSDATSYVSLVDAQNYVDTYIIGVTLTEQSLNIATQDTDLQFRSQYRGSILTDTQALYFPRTEFVDGNGRTVPEGTIPKELQAYVSRRAADVVQGNNTDVINQNANLKSQTQTVEGAVSQSQEWFSATSISTQDQYLGLIQPILYEDAYANSPFDAYQQVI